MARAPGDATPDAAAKGAGSAGRGGGQADGQQAAAVYAGHAVLHHDGVGQPVEAGPGEPTNGGDEPAEAEIEVLVAPFDDPVAVEEEGVAGFEDQLRVRAGRPLGVGHASDGTVPPAGRGAVLCGSARLRP